MGTTTYKTCIPVRLIKQAQNGDRDAIDDVVSMASHIAIRMLNKYKKRNTLIDDEDLLPIFLRHVYENIGVVRLDIGDPGEFLISQAYNKTLAEVARSIKSNTEQKCKSCGHVSRINYGRNIYTCPHTNEICNCDTTIYQHLTQAQLDQGMQSKTKGSARFVGRDGQVGCRCAKKLNRQYYCMRDFRTFLDAMVAECEANKGAIMTLLATQYDDRAEEIYVDSITHTKIQKFHAMYFPDNHRKLRDRVAKNTLLGYNKKPQCSHCGSYDVDIYVTGAADEVVNESGKSVSITEQYIPSNDATDEIDTIINTVITKEEVQEYLDTLRGRERDVMVRLLNGMQASDIARSLGVKPTCITIYKKRGVVKAVKYFIDKLPYIVTEQMLSELRNKYSLGGIAI